MRKSNPTILRAAVLTAFLSFNALAQIASECGREDYKCQIAAYTKQIAADAGNVEAYYNRGRAFQFNGDYDQAITDFTKYIALNTSNKEYLADGYNLRASSYKKKNLLDKAIADYSKAIELVPTSADFWSNRGNAYAAQKSYDAAIPDFTKAIALAPDFAGAYVNRGHAFLNKGDDALALADFTKAMQVDPKEAEAYYNRAVIEGRRGEYSKAIADYDVYISLNTDNIPYLADGYLNRSLAYLNTGNLAQALKDATAAVDLAPKDPKTYGARAAVYRKMGKIALAEADEKKAAALP